LIRNKHGHVEETNGKEERNQNITAFSRVSRRLAGADDSELGNQKMTRSEVRDVFANLHT
jgi:hypothetical protein